MTTHTPPTIEAVQTTTVSIPFRDALVVHASRGTHGHSEFVLVRVLTSDGHEGFGEVSATPMWSGEDAHSATHFIKGTISELLVGKPLASIRTLSAVLDRHLYGNSFTKAGVNTALWDAYSRSLGIPLVEALGGAYRREVPIKISLSGDGEVFDACVAEALGLGFRSFKVKVGLGVDGDIERVRRARLAVGPDASIGVDANTGWTRAEAIRAVRSITEYGVGFVEQPLAEADLQGASSLRSLGIPIVADESVGDADDVINVARVVAADVVSLYVGMAGGPAGVVDTGRVANALGLGVVIGSNGDMGIAAAAQLHSACAIPLLGPVDHDITGGLIYQEDIVEAPMQIDGVSALLPSGPGLGVRPAANLVAGFR